MISLLPRKNRRDPMSLQLTAMIDIFAMIVIFLVKGTVMGVNDIPVPEGMKLPTSFSTESLESAPRITISKGMVYESMFNEKYPLEAFTPEGSSGDSRIAKLSNRLRGFVKNLAPEARQSGVLLNIIADESVPYRYIFDVIRVFRSAGFEAMLFVAQGPAEGQSAPVGKGGQ